MPELITAEWKPDLEEIASYEPDLILGYTAGIPETMYDDISKIAPTYVAVDNATSVEWQAAMTAIGKLTGRSEAAESVITEFEVAATDYASRVAGLQEKTYNSLAVREDGLQFGSGGWLELLGLKAAQNQGSYTDPPLSFERIDELTADVLLAYTFGDGDREKLEGDPRFSELSAVENGTALFADAAMANAATLPGPSGLEWLLEQVVPQLESSGLNGGGE